MLEMSSLTRTRPQFHDDDEDEVQDVAESVTPGTGPKTTSIQGYIANDQFLKLNKAKVIRVLIDDGYVSCREIQSR